MPESAVIDAPPAAAPSPPPAAPPAKAPSASEGREARYAAHATGAKPDDAPDAPAKPSEAKPAPAKPAEAKVEPAKPPEGKVTPVEQPKPGEAAKPAERTNNWRKLEQRAQAAEQRVKQLEAEIVPEAQRTQLTAKATKLESENKRMANLLRFKDYQNSPAFKNEFEAPYIQKFDEATEYFGQLAVTDQETGERRYANQRDLSRLLSLTPNDQIVAIKTLFGDDLAAYVVPRVERVSEALRSMNKALKEGIDNGAAREQEMLARTQTQSKAMSEYVEKTYKDTFAALQAHPEHGAFLKPIVPPEGQQLTQEEVEYNAAIEKGHFAVQKAWSKQPKDCKTKEELNALIKSRVKAGAKAAAFDPVYLMLKRERAAHAKTKEALAAYEKTTPTAGGRQTPAPNTPTGVRDFNAEREARMAKFAR